MYIMSIKIIIIKGSKQTTAPLLFKDEVVELKETYLVGGTSRAWLKRGSCWVIENGNCYLLLCENLLQPKKAIQKDFEELLIAYRKTWAMVGSRAIKKGEIEQLAIIIDAFSSSEQRPVIKFCKMLTGVKKS